MKVFASLAELARGEGTDLGATEWFTIDQPRVDEFASATDDRQWIHVDVEKSNGGPYGGTIAHGLLTLSILPHLIQQLYRVEGSSLGLNYGFNKVRFPAPVPTGSRVRATANIGSVEAVANGIQAQFNISIEVAGSAKPACVAEWIIRFVA